MRIRRVVWGVALVANLACSERPAGGPADARMEDAPSVDALTDGAVLDAPDGAVLDAPADSGVRVLGEDAYIKPSNTALGALFGTVALSPDGSTLAVGAPGWFYGIGGIYVFVRSGSGWVQQYFSQSYYPSLDDHFGAAMALSGDGSTLVVGMPEDDSSGTGSGGDPTNDVNADSGAIYVFVREGSTYQWTTFIKAGSTAALRFGVSVAIAHDGRTIAVGAPGDRSSATTINGEQVNVDAPSSGAAYVFVRTPNDWTQQAYLKASNAEAGDEFGTSVALSRDGGEVVVGAPKEASSASGIGGNAASNAAPGAGAVYVFARAGLVWTQRSYVKASNPDAGDAFGAAVALSADGTTMVVGAPLEASAAVGLGGDQADDSAPDTGAVYLFARTAGSWVQQGYGKPSAPGGRLGASLAISASGARLAAGAPFAGAGGLVEVFTRSGSAWSGSGVVTAPNGDPGDTFGHAVSLSEDGLTLAVGAPREASSATGVGGDGSDNVVPDSGAAYIFE